MVRQGQAVAYRYFSTKYVSAEDAAVQSGSVSGKASFNGPGSGGSLTRKPDDPALGSKRTKAPHPTVRATQVTTPAR